MIPHDAALDAAVGATAYRPFTRVTFLNPTGAYNRFSFVVADTVEGELTSSADEWPRTTLDMQVPTAVVPDLTDLPADPYGGLVRLEAGAVIGATTYVFQVAELDVYEMRVSRPAGIISLRAVSYEARINERREAIPFANPITTASAFVNTYVQDALSPVYANWPVVNTLVTDESYAFNEFMVDGDLWPLLKNVMDDCDAEAYFRYDGALVMRPNPVKGTPVATIKSGAGGTLLSYDSIRRWAPNDVSVRYDDGSGSYTYGLASKTTGPLAASAYGRKTLIEERQVKSFPSTARRNRAAASLLKRASALMRRVEIQCVPMPWLEPGDTIQLQLLGEATENHLITGVRWPLSQLDPMTIITADSEFTG